METNFPNQTLLKTRDILWEGEIPTVESSFSIALSHSITEISCYQLWGARRQCIKKSLNMVGGVDVICLSNGSVLQPCFSNQMTYINYILLATFSGITCAIQFQDKIVQLRAGLVLCIIACCLQSSYFGYVIYYMLLPFALML